MFKNITQNTVKGTLCLGGYAGWYLTVMYICEKSLEIYGTSSFFEVTNIIFGGTLLVLLGVMLMLMFQLDFEGLLNHRYFRAVPAVLLAESGLALAFTNADSFGVYAVITGLCASFGVLAVFTSLLRVRVSQRIVSVALGTALGGAVRLAGGEFRPGVGLRFRQSRDRRSRVDHPKKRCRRDDRGRLRGVSDETYDERLQQPHRAQPQPRARARLPPLRP